MQKVIDQNICPSCGASELIPVKSTQTTGWDTECARCSYKFKLPALKILAEPTLEYYYGANVLVCTLRNSVGSAKIRQDRANVSLPWSRPRVQYDLAYHAWYDQAGREAMSRLTQRVNDLFRIIMQEMAGGLDYNVHAVKASYQNQVDGDYKKPKKRKKKVIIEVMGGVAYVEKCPPDVDVEIVDHDTDEEGDQ